MPFNLEGELSWQSYVMYLPYELGAIIFIL